MARLKRIGIISGIRFDPGGRKRRETPQTTWLQEIEQDLKRPEIDNWRKRSKDRKQWGKICEVVYLKTD